MAVATTTTDFQEGISDLYKRFFPEVNLADAGQGQASGGSAMSFHLRRQRVRNQRPAFAGGAASTTPAVLPASARGNSVILHHLSPRASSTFVNSEGRPLGFTRARRLAPRPEETRGIALQWMGRTAMRATTGTVLVLAMLCASGAAARAAAAPSPPMLRLDGVVPAAVSGSKVRVLGRVDAKRMMSLTLVLRAPRQQELQRIAGEVTDPRSPRFRHFLTFAQWKRRFAPSDEQVAAVERAARADGLSIVHAFADNLGVEVAGSVGTVERAFGVTVDRYRLGSQSFFSSDRDPVIPTRLAGIVQDVQGLSSLVDVETACGSSHGGR